MGGTKVKVPGPSAAETALTQKQAATLDVQNQILQDQLEETRKTRALMEQLTPTTPEEIAEYRAMQAQEQRLTKLLLTKMEEDATRPKTEYEQAQERIGLAEAKRYEQALAGQLPIDEGTTQRKQQEFKALKEGMSRMGSPIAGDTPETATATTTSGQQALESFRKQWGALESGIRQGAIDSGSAQMLGRMGLTSDIAQQNFANQSSFRGMPQYAMSAIGAKGQYGWQPLQSAASGLASGYGSALQPYQFNRNMQYQAGMQTAANKAGLWNSGMNAVGQIVGMKWAAGK